MNVSIVNCFDSYEERVGLLSNFFISEGHQVLVFQSDFSHFRKIEQQNNDKSRIYIHSKPYVKNLSFRRLASHYDFAKKVFDIIEKYEMDLIYVLIPPNALARFAKKYKINHPKVKIVFDLIDLWPETMPFGSLKELFPFHLWAQLRNKNLKYADLVITECDLYQEVLEDQQVKQKMQTLYLAKIDESFKSTPKLKSNEMHLCYLGSINNIIDINKIQKIIRLVSTIKPVTLHIIGDGEHKSDFIAAIKSENAVVIDYGDIFDLNKKQEIFDQCHFGLNIMKKSVCVGLTMKSIDYFQLGLPILNNIKADTTRILNHYLAGLNVDDMSEAKFVEQIVNLNTDDYLMMRTQARRVYIDNFSVTKFYERLKKIIQTMQ